MRLLLPALVTLVACQAPPPASPALPADPAVRADSPPRPDGAAPPLFSFDDGVAAWRIQNDGVMGGRSKGYVEAESGALVFTGTVVTQGGGFTSALAPLDKDLSGYDGIEMCVRGGGRTFELLLDDGTRGSRGRQVSRRAPFPTTAEWETVRVPFDALGMSIHGEPVRAAPFEPADVQGIGLYIIDGQDGPFRLEVDWIRAYADRTDGDA